MIILFVIYMGVAMPEMVYGASMYPNFESGERILVEKVTKHFKEYERGEVVVLHPPGKEKIDYIKRIIGLPGDIVKIKDCAVYISVDNQKFKLQEEYLPEGTCTTEGPKIKEGHSMKIDEDYYLVLGDNRRESADSRVFGLVEEDKILGRVIFRFWPVDRISFL